ncbi:long-chain fatty acid--CoA ligase [Betaproteobacteria bacterium PRO7]|jgi:long-chain acyl-CoA synthetase|nr:long-chain fatty acid--CoA ligase [Betaproteobacteria bacterium PRO7]
MNLAHLLVRTARRLPQMPAVVERGRIELDYAALADRTLRLARALGERLGVRAGGRVALVMKNNAAYVELLYACWAAGICAIPVNVKLHPKEIAFILDDAAARVCFVTDDVDTAAIAAARAGGATEFIDVDRDDYLRLLQGEPGSVRDAAPDDLAWLFYTSGTTGRPKGVMLTHGNLLAMALNYLADVDHAAAGEQLLHAAPMSHGSGLYIVPNVAAGATQLVPASRGFDVAEIDGILDAARGVKFFAAPTMVMRLVDGLRGAARGLKLIVYGGGPMYVADCRRALDRLGPRLVQIYGQGESPMTITVLPLADHARQPHEDEGRWLARLGSVGRAQTGVEVAVFGEDDRAVAAGETGEVVVRGDPVMRGYLNNAEATAHTLAGGWLHTGDLGRLDERGYLMLVDRSKDLIISGGSNIYPREVEEALLLHPAVREVAVIGEPDPDWGENVVAVVVRDPARDCSAEVLDAFCRGHIARFKRPKRYVFVDELPKNATGKVLKRELRERIAAGGRPSKVN